MATAMKRAAGIPLPDTSPTATSRRSGPRRRTSKRSPPTCHRGLEHGVDVQSARLDLPGDIRRQQAHLNFAGDTEVSLRGRPDRICVCLGSSTRTGPAP